MGKIVKLRKSGRSLIITIPKSICELHDASVGTKIEIKHHSSDEILIKFIKE